MGGCSHIRGGGVEIRQTVGRGSDNGGPVACLCLVQRSLNVVGDKRV
jgi:hypothetical protein